MTDLEPSSDWRTWSITVPSPASEQSVTSSPLQTSATLYSISSKKCNPFFKTFFRSFLRVFRILSSFSLLRSKSQLLSSAFFSRSFSPFFIAHSIHSFRAYHSHRSISTHPCVSIPLLKDPFTNFRPSPTIRIFVKFVQSHSFIPVPTDLISIHPHLRFSALKRFSPFHRSSDVSCVIHYFPAQSGYEKCPPPLERRTSFFYLLRLPRIRRTRHESVKLIAK